MPDLTALKNLCSIEINYNYFYKDDKQVLLETNCVELTFLTLADADFFFESARSYFRTDHLAFLSPPTIVAKGRYMVSLQVNPYLLNHGKRGVDILDSLQTYFTGLPDELSISVYDIESANCTRKNIYRILLSERHILRQPFSTFELEMEIRNSYLVEQLSQCCGSPVIVCAQQHEDEGDDAIEIRCIDSEAAKALRVKLFSLANEANLFPLIGFKPSMDRSDCSFILVQKHGLFISQLLMPIESVEAACSSSHNDQYPGFFNHPETPRAPEVDVSNEKPKETMRPELECA